MAKANVDARPVTLTIDGIEVTVPEGATVINAARSAGIYIPYLCDHPALRPWGACRMCTVEIENARGLPTSCTTPVANGMVVWTNTKQVQGLRRNVMELILTEHPIGCLSCHKRDQCGPQETCLRSVAVDFRCVTCPANYRCELQMNCDYVGLDEIALPVRQKNIPLRKDPLIALDWNLCIVCGRCVRVCDEVRAKSVYAMVDRSGKTMIDTMDALPLADSGCIFCGACVDVCPVGAIEERRNRFAGVADSVTESVCNYCSDGCSFLLEQKRGTVIRVAPLWEALANGGMYCVKGRFATAEPLHHPSRLLHPLIRKNGQLVESSWDEALGRVGDEFAKRVGGRVGVIGSQRTTNEATYLLQKFARVALQTPHIDTTARLGDAAGFLGLFNVLGVGASTVSHDAIGRTGCVLVVGSDLTTTSPITGMKLLQAVRPQVQAPKNTGYFSYLPDTSVREFPRPTLIVIDPRKTELAQYADLWLRPAPGTDRALLGAMLKVVLDEGLAPAAALDRIDGVDALRESVAPFDRATVSALTGIPGEHIAEAARRYATATSAVAVFGRGLTQQADGAEAVELLATLAVATGQVGRDDAGILFPVTASNTRGAFDLGALPEFLPGGVRSDDPAGRERLAALWGRPLPSETGYRLMEQLEAARRGEIAALYVVGANPAQSAPLADAALDALEFLVVQDLYLTETAQRADVVLPVASFAEQDGTVTNAERRVQRQRRAIPPVAGLRPDWQIISELGQRIVGHGFDFVHPLEIFEEIAKASPLHAGITYDRLDDEPIAWPCPTADSPGASTLLSSGRITAPVVSPIAPLTDSPADYPLTLSLAASFEHFGTGTQTRLVKEFAKLHGSEVIGVAPADLERLGMVAGQRARVVSPHGSAEGVLRAADALPTGLVTMTIVFPEAGVQRLFGLSVDPRSGTPVLKRTPVRLEALN